VEIVDVETPQHLEHVRQPFSEYFRRLDTADSMTKARGLYASLGLRESAPYYEAPPHLLPILVFMEMSLEAQAVNPQSDWQDGIGP